MAKIYPHIAKELNRRHPNKTLELGCGERQYRWQIDGEYVGIDLRKDYGAPGAIANSCHLPFSCHTFDLVFVIAAAYQFSDGWEWEAWRVLKPGGTLLLFDYKWWIKVKMLFNRKENVRRITGIVRLLKEVGFETNQLRRCVPHRIPYLLSPWLVIEGRKYP